MSVGKNSSLFLRASQLNDLERVVGYCSEPMGSKKFVRVHVSEGSGNVKANMGPHVSSLILGVWHQLSPFFFAWNLSFAFLITLEIPVTPFSKGVFMHDRLKKISVFFVVAIFCLSACGGGYNTNFPTPDPKKKIGESFPMTVAGEARELAPLDVQPNVGYQATYGGGKMSVQMIQAATADAASAYFKDKIVPLFDAMGSHSRGQINGKWYAKGSDAQGEHYGWVNNNWVMVIHAKDKDHLEKLVEALPYIAKE